MSCIEKLSYNLERIDHPVGIRSYNMLIELNERQNKTINQLIDIVDELSERPIFDKDDTSYEDKDLVLEQYRISATQRRKYDDDDREYNQIYSHGTLY